MDTRKANALIHETSPYLLQHAHNPVEWYPWCEEALARARREDKPVLLSIGYSACHWCHVMAHESFEDEETAKVMNEYFVNIKVDREERPDLDKIYQTAQQLLTQRSGGWPLTMFLTPEDHIPFFGGTYFPPQARYGLPGFRELLQRVARYYRENRDAITRQNESVLEVLQSLAGPAPSGGEAAIDDGPLYAAIVQLRQEFDSAHGGFGGAPKFPHPISLERLLRHYIYTGQAGGADPQALSMAGFSLRKMASGGLYDQLGGGFYRYCVDADWQIPHFEKMLYDNGPLLGLYCQAWRITKDPLFKTVAEETADWVMREMQSPEGGYYSTLDADSEGREGKFYVWTKEEAESLLDDREWTLCAEVYGFNRPPNFEGRWHLRLAADPAEAAAALSLDTDTANRLYTEARRKLLEARNKRIRPGRDEKILTSWNGLMIKGMATAARLLESPACGESAVRALQFIRAGLYRDGRLLATCKNGRARLNGYLDDYAFVLDAVLELMQIRWDRDWLGFAVELADALLERFEDREAGGFFYTSHDHEKLIQRSKPLMDDALPAGNGIAASALGRLGHLLGEERYLSACERAIRAGWPVLQHYPSAHNALLLALEDYLHPAPCIVIRGEADAIKTWRSECLAHARPFSAIYAIPADADRLPGRLAERTPQGGAVAYICAGHACRAPVTRIESLRENLNNSKVK